MENKKLIESLLRLRNIYLGKRIKDDKDLDKFIKILDDMRARAEMNKQINSIGE